MEVQDLYCRCKEEHIYLMSGDKCVTIKYSAVLVASFGEYRINISLLAVIGRNRQIDTSVKRGKHLLNSDFK